MPLDYELSFLPKGFSLTFENFYKTQFGVEKWNAYTIQIKGELFVLNE